MSIQHKLRNLQSYLLINRGVGYTTLLRKGTDNYNQDKFILCSTMREGDLFNCRRSEIITMGTLEKLRSHNRPIAIESSGLLYILTESINEIMKLEYENEILNIANKKLIHGNISENTPGWTGRV